MFDRADAACEARRPRPGHPRPLGGPGALLRRRTRRRWPAGPRASAARSTSCESHGLAGTPAEVVEKIATFAEVGVTRVYLQVLDLADLDHLDLVAAEVMAAPARLSRPCRPDDRVGESRRRLGADPGPAGVRA